MARDVGQIFPVAGFHENIYLPLGRRNAFGRAEAAFDPAPLLLGYVGINCVGEGRA
jgi:hypothetical protein